MLIFTRRRDEAIVIGDGIEIRILSTARDSVRIGVSAPVSVAVHRREIYDLIRAENTSAACAPDELRTLIAKLPAGKPRRT